MSRTHERGNWDRPPGASKSSKKDEPSSVPCAAPHPDPCPPMDPAALLARAAAGAGGGPTPPPGYSAPWPSPGLPAPNGKRPLPEPLQPEPLLAALNGIAAAAAGSSRAAGWGAGPASIPAAREPCCAAAAGGSTAGEPVPRQLQPADRRLPAPALCRHRWPPRPPLRCPGHQRPPRAHPHRLHTPLRARWRLRRLPSATRC